MERKPSRIVSYEKLDEITKKLLSEAYPEGFQDDINSYPKSDGSVFYAVNLDTPEANYLIKIDVEIDVAFDDETVFEEPIEEVSPDISDVENVDIEDANN